jgi:lysophospholipase L1-like esterase
MGASAKNRREADIQRYNAAALGIVRRRKIPVNDLHELASGNESWHTPDGVHFQAEGARRLAVQVAAAITRALER